MAPAPAGGQCRIAIAGGDVQHLESGAQIDRLAKFLADDLERGADDGIVSGLPGSVLAGFYRRQIGCGEIG